MRMFLPFRTDEEQARITGDFLPSGSPWTWKNIVSHDGFKWIVGLSKTFGRIEGAINQFMRGLLITEDTSMIDEWEDAVRIPDESFPGNGTLAKRQSHVIVKLSSDGVATGPDYKWLFAKMGLYVNVYPGKDFYETFDPRVGTFSSLKEARFTIVFELIPELSDIDAVNAFPLSFPIQFGASNYDIAQRYTRKIIPAYMNARWFVSDVDTWINTSYSERIIHNTVDNERIVNSI